MTRSRLNLWWVVMLAILLPAAAGMSRTFVLCQTACIEVSTHVEAAHANTACCDHHQTQDESADKPNHSHGHSHGPDRDSEHGAPIDHEHPPCDDSPLDLTQFRIDRDHGERFAADLPDAEPLYDAWDALVCCVRDEDGVGLNGRLALPPTHTVASRLSWIRVIRLNV